MSQKQINNLQRNVDGDQIALSVRVSKKGKEEGKIQKELKASPQPKLQRPQAR